MAYLGTPPRSRVLSSADIDPGSISLDDISFTDQPTNLNLTGTYDKHTMRLADGVTVVGDVTISDNLILSKISDDGNAITLTNDSSTRTITGTGSLEASTLTQTPNASLTGMTGELGSAVTGSPALNLSNSSAKTGSILQVVQYVKTDTSSTTSTTFGDIPGQGGGAGDFKVVLTPRDTNSKILLIADVKVGNTKDWFTHIRLENATTGTALYIADAHSVRASDLTRNFSGSELNTLSAVYLDSPSTSSSVTYRVQWRVEGQTGYINRSADDTANTSYGRGASSLTAMEVAG